MRAFSAADCAAVSLGISQARRQDFRFARAFGHQNCHFSANSCAPWSRRLSKSAQELISSPGILEAQQDSASRRKIRHFQTLVEALLKGRDGASLARSPCRAMLCCGEHNLRWRNGPPLEAASPHGVAGLARRAGSIRSPHFPSTYSFEHPQDVCPDFVKTEVPYSKRVARPCAARRADLRSRTMCDWAVTCDS